MPSFYFPFQCELVSCCMLIHNFIRRNQVYLDGFDNNDDVVNEVEVHDNVVEEEGALGHALNAWRDQIAYSMWLAYLAYQAGN